MNGRAFRRRDPASPDEFDRHQRLPPQHVLFRWDGAEVFAIFPNMRKSKTDNRRMVGREWVSRAEIPRLVRATKRATPGEEKEIRDHLIYDHGYRIRAWS